MPDISMCTGEGCPKAKQCYRHTATPTPGRQSYFWLPPWRQGMSIECGYFIPDEAARTSPRSDDSPSLIRKDTEEKTR